MKKIICLLLISCFLIKTGNGQSDEIRPAAIGISFILNDFSTASKIRSSSLSSVLANGNWTKLGQMSPGIGISYFKGLSKHLDFAGNLAGSFVSYPVNGNTSSSEKGLLELDAAANFKLVSERYWVQPYAILGAGAQLYGKSFGAYIPTGLGLKVNFMDETHLFTTAQYRIPVTTSTSAYRFMYQLGVAGRVGKTKEPELKPLPPAPPVDTDKDGIIDSLDKCPTVPGLAKYNGCPIPDTDKDGINDEEDKCPDVAGLARYGGCPIPDTDKDGINDEEDKCPTEAGPASNQGCPFIDTDGDGVADADDKCPTVAGTKANYGCPEIKEEVITKINFAAQNIYFASGKHTLLSKSFKGLDEVAQIMKDNAETILSIDGHTDNTGSDELNQKLSENRAAAVKNYLVKKGVEESRLTAAGHGPSNPVADNKTAAGRQKNRRVELKLGY